MSSKASSQVIVASATVEQRAKALWIVFSDQQTEQCTAQVASALAAVKEGPYSLEGLFVAERQGLLVGAQLGYVQVGKTAFVYPPRLVQGEDESTAHLLSEQLDTFLRSKQVAMSQVVLGPEDEAAAEQLCKSGWSEAAQLSYLICLSEHFPTEQPSGELTFVPYEEQYRQRLSEVLQKTYEQTLDLPVLNGQRRMEDVLEGYQQTGKFIPECWSLVQYEEQDVGCLLLADYPEQDQWELVYMGLIPEARGKGWGREIVRRGQWLAHEAGRRQILLAVDSANHPAHSIYTSCGFTEWLERRVLLKFYQQENLA